MPATGGQYGWTMPTVGGDTGAWGTILNTLLDAIDDGASVLRTILKAKIRVAGGAGFELMGDSLVPGTHQWHQNSTDGAFGVRCDVDAGDVVNYYVPIPVREGQTITDIETYGSSDGGNTGALLVRIAADGTETVVSAGHSLPAVEGAASTGSLAHAVVADCAYCVKIAPSASGLTTLRSVAAIVTVALA